MAGFRVTAPVAGFDGTVAGVRFSDGYADVDAGPALAYFRSQGYTVEPEPAVGLDVDFNPGPQLGPGRDLQPESDADLQLEPESKRPAVADPKADWVYYATTCGISEADANTMTKADLIDEVKARESLKES